MRRSHWLGRSAPLVGMLIALAGCGGTVMHVHDCVPGDGLVPVCGFQNPEDLAATEGGSWLIVSQYPQSLTNEEGAGSLLAYRPSDARKVELELVPGPDSHGSASSRGDPSCTEPPGSAQFAPHGIDLVGDRLFVVNHGGREAIELFDWSVEGDEPRLRWVGCVPLPGDAMANDVIGTRDGRIVATRMMPRGSSPLTMLRVALGWDTGYVISWSPAHGWAPWPNTEGSAPNGVELSEDGQTVYYAAWGSNTVVRVSRDGADRREVGVGFHPDNLTWASDGRLLVAGQGGSIASITSCGDRSGGTCGMPFAVAAIEPDTLAAERLIDHDPARVGGAASVALEYGDELWIGTFAGDRLLRWRAP